MTLVLVSFSILSFYFAFHPLEPAHSKGHCWVHIGCEGGVVWVQNLFPLLISIPHEKSFCVLLTKVFRLSVDHQLCCYDEEEPAEADICKYYSHFLGVLVRSLFTYKTDKTYKNGILFHSSPGTCGGMTAGEKVPKAAAYSTSGIQLRNPNHYFMETMLRKNSFSLLLWSNLFLYALFYRSYFFISEL